MKAIRWRAVAEGTAQSFPMRRPAPPHPPRSVSLGTLSHHHHSGGGGGWRLIGGGFLLGAALTSCLALIAGWWVSNGWLEEGNEKGFRHAQRQATHWCYPSGGEEGGGGGTSRAFPLIRCRDLTTARPLNPQPSQPLSRNAFIRSFPKFYIAHPKPLTPKP